MYRDRLGPIEMILPCEDRGAERRSWFVYVVQPGGTDRDAVITELADSGVAAKPYRPAST